MAILPHLAWAQEVNQDDPPLTPPPVVAAPQEAHAAQAPVTEQESRALAPAAPMTRPARWTLEALGGGLGAVGGGLGGALLGCAIAGANGGEWACLGGVVLGGLAGIAVGIPAGVSIAGMLAGAESSPLYAVAGMLVGGVATWALVSVTGNTLPQYAPYTLLILPIVGSVLGFELFAAPEPTAQASRGRTLRMQPLLALASDGRGGVVGLGGVF